jgi:hypothetical protein
LPNLTDQEGEELLARLLEWNGTTEIEETPELLAAIDQGTWSAENEPMSTLEDVKKRLEGKVGLEIRLTKRAEEDLNVTLRLRTGQNLSATKWGKRFRFSQPARFSVIELKHALC